jgi:hypothetical protein
VSQVQKLELDWPEQISNFFAMLNILSLSFSGLSPRCVVSDWEYLNKVPIMNSIPPGVFVLLLCYQYAMPRAHYGLAWVAAALRKKLTGRRAASTKKRAMQRWWRKLFTVRVAHYYLLCLVLLLP